MCLITASYVGRNSEHAKHIVKECIDICNACGNECEKHDHDHCKKCAEACRKCVEACEAY